MAFVVLVCLLWLPGALYRRASGTAPGPWGTGRFAVEAALSLAWLTIGLLPLYLLHSTVWTAAVLCVVQLPVLALPFVLRDRSVERPVDRVSALEGLAFVAAVALLLPATLAHAGANVDDWWDLSFVSGWLADGHFGFAQMALTPDPVTHVSPAHPRFLWSIWLMLQAIAALVTGEAAWKIQAGPLAAIVCVLVVSAQAALARALFRGREDVARLTAATLLMTAAWIWGTEALPLFVRGYQDKLVAAFVLAPVLVAVFLDAMRAPSRLATALVLNASIATVSVHSLVLTMAIFVCGLAALAVQGRGIFAWLRENAWLVLALTGPAIYPLGQAAWLAGTFAEQGVSLATRDNPVVRAHLSLNRLVGDVGPAWIVHPGAVFGTVALVAVVAFVVAWRRRRAEPAARILVVLSAVPCALLFVPGLAALAGKLWVPWMLYRLGWLVPVAPLVAYAVVELARTARENGRRPIAASVLALAAAILSVRTASDRLSRGMNEHPGQPSGAPIAAAASVFDYLAHEEGRAPVLALANFSELVPAITGKPVVAFPERGTLVFAGDEALAYERLRDRATFFANATPPAARDDVALRYGVRWAVLPRRQIASGSEAAWLWRFGPEAFLATRAGDESEEPPCDGPECRTWWSATRESTLAHLSKDWTIVLETRDYFVVELVTARAAVFAPERRAPAGGEQRWLSSFDLTPADAPPATSDVLASATDAPGAFVSFSSAPRYILPSVLPIWSDGPLAWEDAPMDSWLTLDMDGACRVSAVEVVAHLPRDRREVFEVSVDGRVVRAAPKHNGSIFVTLDDSVPRRSVKVAVTSLLGNPVSLADVRLLGDASSCEAGWPRVKRPRSPELAASDSVLLAAGEIRPGGRPFVSLARHAGRSRGKEAAASLLREATRRDPSLVEAWIELGFAEDDLAAAATTPEAKDAAGRSALEAFRGAVRADSRSAWARGCLAWAEYRAGHALRGLVQSIGAASLDPLYADSWTILAYPLADLHLAALAEWSLSVAEAADPSRNWPALARADIAMKHRDTEAARSALREWIAKHPFDDVAQGKLAGIEAAAQGGAPTAESGVSTP